MSDLSGLSILIPVYNCIVTDLVRNLSNQAIALGVPYEIRCYDDQSAPSYVIHNKEITQLPNVVFRVLDINIGRSAIRNKLGEEALYDYLLFIDSDSAIIHSDYLKNYWQLHDTVTVVAGGTCYDTYYDPAFALRFHYGKKREEKLAHDRNRHPYQHVTFNNLLLPGKIFLDIKLDESIRTYGHEDTKFASSLAQRNIKVVHIQNPVLHSGLEHNHVFLEKTKEGIKNFYKIISQGYGRDSKLYRSFRWLKKSRLMIFFEGFYALNRRRIDHNLNSSKPSLFFFDLYKLHLLIQEDKKNRKRI